MHQLNILEIARQATQQPEFEVTRWQIESLHVLAMSASTYGMYRLSGNGSTPQHPALIRDWSVILKILKRPPGQSEDKQQLGYWQREKFVYQCGILDDLPWSLQTPRCFAITEHAQNDSFIQLFNFDSADLATTCWLWLEDLTEIYCRELPLPLYAQAARALGQLNGSYLTGARSLPTFDWLGHNFLSDYIRLYGSNLQRMQQANGWEQSELNRLFGRRVAEGLQRLDSQKELFLTALAKLPQTLAHSDAHRDNFIAYPGVDGAAKLRVIDWADLGINSLGQDPAALVGLSLGAYKDLQTDPFKLDATIFPEYLGGLAEAGWNGSENLVRLGFSLTVALRWGHALARNVGWYWLDGRQEWLERCYGCPIQESLANWAHMGQYVLERATEARRLLNQL